MAPEQKSRAKTEAPSRPRPPSSPRADLAQSYRRTRPGDALNTGGLSGPELLEAVVDGSPIALVVVDLAGVGILWNSASDLDQMLLWFVKHSSKISDGRVRGPAGAMAAEALAFGRDAATLEEAGSPPDQIPHRVCEGNRPTTAILLDRLTPENLGKLIALYEHRVFTEGTIWAIDSFDQWGVELGKILANQIESEVQAEDPPELAHDSSTNELIRRYRTKRGRAN